MSKKIFTLLLVCCVLLSGCTNKDISKIFSSNVDIYVSDDVDVFGNKIEEGDVVVPVKPNSPNEELQTYPSSTFKGTLKVYFLDVGQADSVFIQINDDENILIDGGNNNDGEDIVNYLKHLGISDIDTIIATHPHEDHIGGLDTIINSIDVDKIYLPYINEEDIPSTITYDDFLQSILNNDLLAYEAKNGDVLYETQGIKLEILSPSEVSPGDLNDYSIVTKLTFGNTSFLFTGDASNAINDFIMNNYNNDDLDIDVLKVGHHGSYTSTSDDWIKITSPEYSIIMCGKDNSYGHPHDGPMSILNKYNSNILRTDIDGTILITSDGYDLSISKNLTGKYSLGEKQFDINNIK